MFKRNTKEEENKKIKQQWNYSDVHIAHERRTWTQETVTPFVIQISKFILLYKHIGESRTQKIKRKQAYSWNLHNKG